MTILQAGVLVTLRGALVHTLLRGKVAVDSNLIWDDAGGDAVHEAALGTPTAVGVEHGGFLGPGGQSKATTTDFGLHSCAHHVAISIRSLHPIVLKVVVAD